MHGKLSCLMINDLDAGIGHFENTQVSGGTTWCASSAAASFPADPTGAWPGLCLLLLPPSQLVPALAAPVPTPEQITVNNQIVVGTLMNIAGA